jgi:hypothetical protein
MQKNRDFLRKVRLCLWLVFGLGLFGCSVLKPQSEPVTDLKTYRLTINMLPGSDENGLLAALDGAAIINIDRLPFVQLNIGESIEQFTLSIRVNGEIALKRIFLQLQSSGFIITNYTLYCQ